MNPQDQINNLEKRVRELEQKTKGIQTNAFLNQYSVDPQSASFLQDFIAIPFTNTGTITITPPKNGYRYVVQNGGVYTLNIYANGAWRTVTLT